MLKGYSFFVCVAVIVIRAEAIAIALYERGGGGGGGGDRLMGVCGTFWCQRYACCVELLLAGVQTVSQRRFAAWGFGGRGQGERRWGGYNQHKTSTKASPCK